MLDPLLQNWNALATLAALVGTLIIGRYQIRHYRAESPDPRILNVEDATYYSSKENGDAATPGGEEHTATKYEFNARIENRGRKGITVTGGRLFVEGEEIDIDRYEGSTKISFGAEEPNMPHRVDSDLWVEGKGTAKFKGWAIGDRREITPESVEGTVELRGAGGDMFEQRISFEPYEQLLD